MKDLNKKRLLNIAIFHLGFIYSGGGEKLVLEEARGLEKRGHQVTIFTPIMDGENCFPDIINKFNIKTFLPQLPAFIPQWETFQILLICVLAPLLAHRFKNFDIILAANQPSLWLAWFVKKFYRVPYVAYLAQPTRFLYPRDIDQEVGLIFVKRNLVSPATYLVNKAKPLARWADKVSVKGADLILANGEHARRVLGKTYGIKAVSCPAGAYPVVKLTNYANRFSGTLKIDSKKITKPYILLTNRHFSQKRFEYAIFAMNSILGDNLNFSLLITGGETEYTKSLKNLVKQLSLGARVNFLGLVTEKDLKKLYGNAVVYVYTAPEEDFGMGMVEAMAYGTPVVAWNKGGPSYIVENGKTGFLAKPLVLEDFTDKILKIIRNKRMARAMAKKSWERAKERFSYENHLQILEKALLEKTENS